MGKKVIAEEIIDVDEVGKDVDGDVDEVVVNDAPLDVDDIIAQAVKKQTTALNKAVATVKTRVDGLDDRVAELEQQNQLILEMMKAKGSTPEVTTVEAELVDDRNIVDKTLGAVGTVLHGVVDTAAFVLESTVDLVTLGRARREM